jgi:tetratricopeptide (TPR) repeat protein
VFGKTLQTPAARVLDLVQSLRDKSLLYAIATADGPRFHLYVGIREFVENEAGAEQLGVGDAHASHYVVHAEAEALALERSGDSAASSWLFAERDNVLAAHEHSVQRAGALSGQLALAALDAAARAALALEAVLLSEGPAEALAEMLDGVLLHSDAGGLCPRLLARSLRARAKARQLHGGYGCCRQDLERALALAESENDPAITASVLTELGVLLHRREPELAQGYYERALDMYVALGDRRQEARARGNLGALSHDLGDFRAADAHYAESLARFRRLDEPRWEGIFMTNRGILQQEQGRFEQAREHYASAVERLTLARDKRLLGITRGNWGVLEHERGDTAQAAALHDAALAELREVGDVPSEALCLSRLAAAHAACGRATEARSAMVEAERLLESAHDAALTAAARLNFLLVELSAATSLRELRQIQQRMQQTCSTPAADGRSVCDVSDDVRSTLRILKADYVRKRAALRVLDPGEETLQVGPEARWFCAPGGRRQNLVPYGAPRRILLALIEAGNDAGAELSLEALREAGWPRERIDIQAANNRVHVALAPAAAIGPAVLARAQ